ncbi:hypothetical protein [Phyllobacterium chamaecytisi]|uniref:hypothetical protein n=1 Tax=Phyllobacterium chamaecytisi TaxID=2876082 RepID=UPI001CCF894C|nr:hypothetical protein [Phyllobacterium sp. KW56]MBZ9604869.1 hypothetical protein [Phyllobacterium sp. KW56]
MPTEKQLDKMLKHAEDMEARRLLKAAEKAARRANNKVSIDAIVAAAKDGEIDLVTLRRNAINSVVTFAQLQVPDLLAEWLEIINDDDPSSTRLNAIQAMLNAATGNGKYFTGPKQLAAALKGLTVEEQYAKVREMYAEGMIPEEQSKALLAIVEAADKSESRDLRARLAAAEAKIEFYETGKVVSGEVVPEQEQITNG